MTRSAVSQTWNRLQEQRNLNICSNIDLGKLGLFLIFGWARDEVTSSSIGKFAGWLKSSPFVVSVSESLMTSSLDTRVCFEVILPPGDRYHWFISQLSRFTKKPHNLSMSYDVASDMASYLNLGSFDGNMWEFTDGFKFEASIDAAKGYADVLPIIRTTKLSKASDFDFELALIAAAMERNYLISSNELDSWLKERGVTSISTRTLRRRLAYMRENLVRPYLSLEGIGLRQKITVCLDEPPQKGSISRLLHAQAITFPKTRLISGEYLTTMDIDLPETVDWLRLSQSMTTLASPPTRISTCLVQNDVVRKGLESVVLNLNEQPS